MWEEVSDGVEERSLRMCVCVCVCVHTSRSLAGFPSPCFYANFGVALRKSVMETPKKEEEII